jgi:Na+/H+-translocating membrane pyrophosphatase
MLDEPWTIFLILASCGVTLGYSLYNNSKVKELEGGYKDSRVRRPPTGESETLALLADPQNREADAKRASIAVYEEAKYVLGEEIKNAIILAAIIALFIIFFVEPEFGTFWLTLSFVVGVLTVIACVYYGLNLACVANYKTVLKAKLSVIFGFKTGYRAAISIAFFYITLGILAPFVVTLIYRGIHPVIEADHLSM